MREEKNNPTMFWILTNDNCPVLNSHAFIIEIENIGENINKKV